MSEYAWFTGTFVMTIFMLFILIDISNYNSSINCPVNIENNPAYMFGNSTDVVTQSLNMLAVFVSPCSGLPWWVYALLIIMFVADVIFVLPFFGS